jgi:hypothetical protein
MNSSPEKRSRSLLVPISRRQALATLLVAPAAGALSGCPEDLGIGDTQKINVDITNTDKGSYTVVTEFAPGASVAVGPGSPEHPAKASGQVIFPGKSTETTDLYVLFSPSRKVAQSFQSLSTGVLKIQGGAFATEDSLHVKIKIIRISGGAGLEITYTVSAF